MLIQIPDVLTPDELMQARQWLAEVDWVDGRVTAGTQAALVKNNQQLPEQAPQLPQLRALVLQALHRDGLFFTAALPLKILPPFFNRYSGSTNTYGSHVDNAVRRMPDGSGYVRADVSATLFLSEPDGYEGGELVINDTFGQHGLKLKAGSMVVYASSSVHQVKPITRGERVACFMFIQSMVRSPEHRRQLFDLDRSIMELRASVGETESVLRLTGIYHNLLRAWAE